MIVVTQGRIKTSVGLGLRMDAPQAAKVSGLEMRILVHSAELTVDKTF